MKKFLKNSWIYLFVVIVALIIMIADNNSRNIYIDMADIEEQTKEMVEASEIRVNDLTYRGVYGTDEISELPEGYVLAGELKECKTDGELTENLTSNSINPGYPVYVNKTDNSKILLRVTTDEDEYQAYIQYNLKTE